MSARAKKALAAASAIGLVGMVASYFVKPWEGTENRAYWDRLGKVWTICSGRTEGVHPGMVMTDAECDRDLYRRLERDYHRPLQVCVKGFDRLPLGLQGMLLDLAWNVGAETVCHSTAVRRAKAGDYRGACEAGTWFDRAGGKVVSGLKKRRTTGDGQRIGELELCLTGLKK